MTELKVNYWNRLPGELHEKILGHLSLPDLVAFSRIDSPLSQGHLVGRIVRLLERFHLSYDEVMTLLKKTHSRMTGLAVLEIVKPSSIPDTTLDFVVAQGFHQDAVSFFNESGYTVLEESERMQVQLRVNAEQELSLLPLAEVDTSVMYLPDDSIVDVVNLTHPRHGTRVTLIQASTSTSLIPVLTLCTTLVMNWITHNTVACAYPSLTTSKQGFRNTLPWWTHPRTEATLEYYQQIGFTILDRCTQLPYHTREECNSSNKRWKFPVNADLHVKAYCQRRLRSMNDGLTVSMSINRPSWLSWRGGEDSEQDISWQLCRRSEGRELCKTRRMHGEIAGAHQLVVYCGTCAYYRVVQPPLT
ncbi:hypothetical protein BKA70DRAFT_1240660 [Coprinopsis sp. MPI-PUGE-AT-0042]|nr:hypothetical protein BKA70DRAFT_1240660 [Coprinopsis sp. MPI-PUGE-AT-0042]